MIVLLGSQASSEGDIREVDRGAIAIGDERIRITGLEAPGIQVKCTEEVSSTKRAKRRLPAADQGAGQVVPQDLIDQWVAGHADIGSRGDDRGEIRQASSMDGGPLAQAATTNGSGSRRFLFVDFSGGVDSIPSVPTIQADVMFDVLCGGRRTCCCSQICPRTPLGHLVAAYRSGHSRVSRTLPHCHTGQGKYAFLAWYRHTYRVS